jgi:hypothetical protein
MPLKPTPFIVRNTILPFILLILIFICGCGAFKQGTFDTDNSGAFKRHYISCGPKAIGNALEEFSHLNLTYSDIEISREIQKSGNITRMIMSVFNQEAMEITWPHELVNFLTSKGFIVEEVEFDDLKSGDIAIVLIKKDFHTYHWITYPTSSKETIKNFFYPKNKIVKTLLIKKRAAN